jgi:hypothetical protein
MQPGMQQIDTMELQMVRKLPDGIECRYGYDGVDGKEKTDNTDPKTTVHYTC